MTTTEIKITEQHKAEIAKVLEAIEIAEGAYDKYWSIMNFDELLSEYGEVLVEMLDSGKDLLYLFNWMTIGSTLTHIPWTMQELEECYPESAEMLSRF